MKRFFLFFAISMALTSIGCARFYYAKDLRDNKVVEFRWLKEMEEYVFNKKSDADRTGKERMFYLACYFDAEMQRGGFSLYFKDIAARTKDTIYADLVIRDTISALKQMEMNDRADILEKTHDLYRGVDDFNTAAGRGKTDIEKTLAECSNRYDRLSAGDRYFLEGLIVKTNAFVEKNIDEFYIMR